MFALSIDSEDLRDLARALSAETNGKALRRDLAKNLRAALEPAKVEVRANLMSMASAGVPVDGPPLRTAILKNMKADARLTGRSAGARLRIRKKGMPRGFNNAPKRLNRKAGWRHKVWGRDVWVQQFGKPDYFDDATTRRRGEYRRAVIAAMNECARRIARKV